MEVDSWMEEQDGSRVAEWSLTVVSLKRWLEMLLVDRIQADRYR